MTRGDELTRTEILTRAGAFLRQHGYDRTTIRALADHLGVAASGLYYHFPNKESLVVSSLDLDMDALIARAREALDSERTHPARLRRFLEIHVESQLNLLPTAQQDGRSSLHGLTVLLAAVSPEASRRITQKQRQFLDLLRDLLRDGVKRGDFAIPDVTVTAFALLSLGEHLVHWFRTGGRLSPREVGRDLVELGMRMVRKPAA